MKTTSVILLSGGLDSAANLAFAAQNASPTLAITLHYGQKAAKREIQASRQLCSYYKIPHSVIDLPWLGGLGGSSLTDLNQKIPEIQDHQLEDPSTTKQTARAVWVPNRNGIFIHLAAAYAESQKADQVIVGFNAEEAATFPDNSLDYIDSLNRALSFSTSNHVKVFSYTVEWNKTQIVSELKRLRTPFPFEMVWSCYEGNERACQICESCKRLARALRSSSTSPH